MYDVIIFRKRMAPEVAKAALAKFENPKVFLFGFDSIDDIPEGDLAAIPDGKILVIGTYFELPTIQALKAKGDVTVFCYSEREKDKYGTGISYITELFSDAEIGDRPWLARMLRRISTEGTEEDDLFVWGVLQSREPVEIANGDMLVAFTRVVGGDLTEHQAVMNGKAVVAVYGTLSASIVATSGARVRFHGYNARFVCGATEPVMPVVKEAAKDHDLGVVIRYNVKDGTTTMTFYTENPRVVDLSFVDRAPYNGGGSDECKGRTFRGLHIAPPKMNGSGDWEFIVPCKEI